jgi:hypothetical protein
MEGARNVTIGLFDYKEEIEAEIRRYADVRWPIFPRLIVVDQDALASERIQDIAAGHKYLTLRFNTEQTRAMHSRTLTIPVGICSFSESVGHRVSLTPQCMCGDHEREFGGKNILFVEELLQLPPVIKEFSRPVPGRLMTRLPYCECRRDRYMQNGYNALAWWRTAKRVASKIGAQSKTSFAVNMTPEIKEAEKFFCEGVEPEDPFPLDRLWICPRNKLANEINRRLHDWRKKQTQPLGRSRQIPNSQNCSSAPLAEAHQIEFIRKLDMPELTPDKLDILEGR